MASENAERRGLTDVAEALITLVDRDTGATLALQVSAVFMLGRYMGALQGAGINLSTLIGHLDGLNAARLLFQRQPDSDGNPLLAVALANDLRAGRPIDARSLLRLALLVNRDVLGLGAAQTRWLTTAIAEIERQLPGA